MRGSYISLKGKKKGKLHLLILNWKNVFKLIAKCYFFMMVEGGSFVTVTGDRTNYGLQTGLSCRNVT